MSGISLRTVASFALLLLAACGKAPSPSPPPPAAAPAARADVTRVVEDYWNAHLALNPLEATAAGDHRFDDRIGMTISIAYLADSLALERRALQELLAVPSGSLDAATRVTYEIFKRERELAIEGFTYPSELFPVNPFEGLPQRFAQWGSGGGAQPFASARDYENWIARSREFRLWSNQAIANMRDGMRRGYTLPQELAERTAAEFGALGEDSSSNPFYLPLQAMPAAIAEPARSELSRRLAAAIKDQVLPAYRNLHDFLKNEYLPRSRRGLSLADLALGEAWYAYLVKCAGGGDSTPAQVHALGLAEAERLRVRLQSLLAETAFAGNIAGYTEYLRSDPHTFYLSRDELLVAYQDLETKETEAAAALFTLPPHLEYAIHAIARGAEAALPALFYEPAAHSGAPGTLYVNASNLQSSPAYALTARSLNHGIPGRHLQRTVQQSQDALPGFRRFAAYPAFTAGWGAYAASLGDELGLYRDPPTRFGALMADYRDTVALVVDTGLHAAGWTRQRALDYLKQTLAVDDAEANETVERAAAVPAQSLAPKLGELAFQAMRLRAQQQQGAAFDVRAFHAALLAAGPMPLDILEARMNQWILAPPALPAAAAAQPASTAEPASSVAAVASPAPAPTPAPVAAAAASPGGGH